MTAPLMFCLFDHRQSPCLPSQLVGKGKVPTDVKGIGSPWLERGE